MNPNKKYVRGQEFSCVNKSCNKKMKRINCPFCYENKELMKNKDNSVDFGQTIICENKKCKKKYYYFYCPTCKTSKIKKGERTNKYGLIECPKCNINDNSFSVFLQCEKFNFLNCPKCLKNFYYLESDINENVNYIKCPYTNCNEITYLSETYYLSLDKKSCSTVPGQFAKGRINDFKDADFYFDVNIIKGFQRIKTEDIYMENLKEKARELVPIYQVPFNNELENEKALDNQGKTF